MDFLINLFLKTILQVWVTFQHNWPFLVVSVLVAVALKLYLDPNKVSAFLIRYRKAGVIGATAAAVATPLCSCGTTAIILGMMAGMMPWAPIVAFMVASPLTSPEELIYSAGLFGWPFALTFFIASILLGLLGGLAAGLMENRGWLANQARLAVPGKAAARQPKPAVTRTFALSEPALALSSCGCGSVAVEKAAPAAVACGCGSAVDPAPCACQTPIPDTGGDCACESAGAPASQSACGCGDAVREPAVKTCGCGSSPAAPAPAACGCGSSPAAPAATSCGCGSSPDAPAATTCGCGTSASTGESAAADPAKARVTPRMFLSETLSTGQRLLVMFLGFAFIGYFLNGLIPAAWVSAFFGVGNAYSVPLAATLGLPLYINTEASLPLVRALIDGGMSQGAALAFLITGAGTSFGAIAGALTIARWRVIALVIGSLWVGGVAIGYLYNLLLASGLL